MWRGEEILETVRGVLERRDQELRVEQSVYGLDSLNETGLHAVIAEGLAGSAAFGGPAWGVLREQPYPHEWRNKRRAVAADEGEPGDGGGGAEGVLPSHRDRQRCDLVLTPEPGQVLGDPLQAEKVRRSVRREGTGTLFEQAAAVESERAAMGAGAFGGIRSAAQAIASTTPPRVAPEDAYWLELKVVAQFACTGDIPGPNRTYASELLRGVAMDVAKLGADPKIARGAALLLLFTIDQATADHDVVVVMHRCLDRDLPVCAPLKSTIAIPDRIGNCQLSAWLVEVRK